jgi:hypothetical protein
MLAVLLVGAVAAGCGGDGAPVRSPLADEGTLPPVAFADVIAVAVSGEPGSYELSVTVRSPDTGCEQWADWWEVVSVDGEELLYRRVLLHSHAEEQPFTRNGGPIDLEPGREVVVRAHMNTGGYGGQTMRGSVAGGFEAFRPDAGFGARLASLEPLPAGCAG